MNEVNGVSPEKQEVGSIEKSPAPGLQLVFRQTPTIGKLAGALAKAQGEFTKVEKDAENPAFKRGAKASTYAELASVIGATRPALSANGLAIIQSPKSGIVDGSKCIIVSTMLAHSSGEWIADELAWPVAAFTSHGVGSAVTYGRRYAMSAMLGVAGEDDDGNAASGVGGPLVNEAEDKRIAEDFDQRTADQRTNAPEYIAEYQKKAIEDAMDASGKTDEGLTTYLNLAGIDGLAKVKKGEDFQKLLKWAVAKSATTSPVPKSDGKPKPATKKEGHNWPALFAGAREKGYDEEQVKDFYTRKYGVQSGTELSGVQFEEVKASVAAWIDVSH